MQIINNTAQYSELKRMQSQLDADASNAQRLQNTLENLKGIKGKEHIPTAAKGFESLFIYRMLEEMRKTVPQNSLFGDSFGMDVFMSMLDEKVANRIAESGRFGISSMLIDYLEKKMEREEAAVDSQKARNTETKIQKESSIKTESNTDDTTKTLSPSSSGSLDIMERIQSFMHHINEAAEKYKIDPENLFLYHKTTNRALYDSQYKLYSSKSYFDVVFLNTRNEVAEGAISNIIIQKDGRLYTPPVASGLLAGIFRQHLLNIGKAKESPISLGDLLKADKIFACNSVRGMVEVKIKRV